MQSVPTYLLVSVLLITLVVLAIFRSVVLPLSALVPHSCIPSASLEVWYVGLPPKPTSPPKGCRAWFRHCA